MKDFPKIRTGREGPVGYLWFDRLIKHNALTQQMLEAIPDCLEAFQQNRDIRVLVVAGADNGPFCSGLDITELREFARDTDAREANRLAIRQAVRAIRNFPKPLIAEIRGSCMGAGLALALAADLRLCRSDAVFAVPPARLGLVYPLRETRLLIDTVGPLAAKEMLFTGRTVKGEEAARIGLVNRVAQPGFLKATVEDIAYQIADQSPSALHGIKRIANLAQAGIADDTEETVNLFLQAYDSADFREGIAAFVARRQPIFRND